MMTQTIVILAVIKQKRRFFMKSVPRKSRFHDFAERRVVIFWTEEVIHKMVCMGEVRATSRTRNS